MMFRSLHRNIQIRIITSFLTRAVGSMVFPFMAIYFADKMGKSTAGLLLFLNVVATFITSLYGGYVTDRIGRKKVLVAGQSVQVLSFAFMIVANLPQVDSAWLMFWMMMLNGVSGGLTNPAAEAMLIDVSTKETRKFMYSLNYWAINLSIMIGALLGGLLFKTHRMELFIGLTAVSLLTMYLMVFHMTEVFKAEPKREKKNVWRDMLDNYRVVMKDRRFLLFSLATVFILSLEFQMNSYIGVRLHEEFQTVTFPLWGGNSFTLDGIRMLSWITTENTMLIVCFTVLMNRWMERFPDQKVLYIGIAMQACAFAVHGSANLWMLLLFAGLFQTAGEMMYVPVRQSILADIVDEDSRGSYMAVNGLVFQTAKMVGTLGLTVGALIGSYGMSLLYLLLGMISILLFKISVGSMLHAVPVEHRQEASR
ncbi:MDR family MFS transporter [Ectobacillus ponti]|uniref:MFS transporter n=1 Tax=Ectobacillus ponti TaxID=2961894 RepID=A0AA42BNF5_9BACI|nr:MFS transporter [Ectobacillus ponti]MCP8967930.1 MFS transporter [Ectobacillus ponti]